MFENAAAADLAIGRSTVRQRILALLIPETAGRLHLREIQRRVGTSPGTASRELARLVAAGLIDREQEGAQVYFKASTTPFAAMMRSLLALAPDAAVPPRPARVPRAGKAPVGAAISPPIAETGVDGVHLGDSEVPAASTADEASPPAGATPGGGAPPARMLATTGAAMEGPLADIVASAISQLTTAASSAEPRPPISLAPIVPFTAIETTAPDDPARADASTPDDTSVNRPAPRVPRPAEAPAGDIWTGVPDPALIEIIRRRAAADPLGLKIARRLADSVESIYGERLRGMYMFGRRATGPADDTADVETLIVLDEVDRYGAELERTSHACAALSHEYGLVVSRVFVSEEDWADRADGSLPMIRAEAVVA